MFIVTRSAKNPILQPNEAHPWESVATFNPAPVIEGGKAHVFYRALARPDVLLNPHVGRSTVGYAVTEQTISVAYAAGDGKRFTRLLTQVGPMLVGVLT